MSAYNLRSLKLPRLTGTALKAFATACETPALRTPLIANMMESGGIPRLRAFRMDDPPTYTPLVNPPADSPAPESFEPAAAPAGFPYRTILDFVNAYRDGSLTPLQAAERFLAQQKESDTGPTPLRAYVAIKKDDLLAQAAESTRRFIEGRPLSLLDGVPIAIKDEVDQMPYPSFVGTSFLGSAPVQTDATITNCLRAAGALLTGKTNMHEIGINPNGSNARWGAVRNPYNATCDTGGSSSGSAAAVAAGLVPAAIGADGGGSIRIPAGLCGVVGLKPTYGRVSEAGAAPLCWSVGHLGPLAASTADAALIYLTIAGPDPRDANSLRHPPVTLAGWQNTDLHGLRLGIYPEWFEHADPEVVAICKAQVEAFRAAGAEIQTIEIPELDEMRIAHVITILSEMAASMKNYRAQRKLHSGSTRISLAMAEAFTATEYVMAQRMRTRALAHFAAAFTQVDAILTPATALAAQPIPEGGADGGWSDLSVDTELMRFVFPSNFTGSPAITFPAGYDSRGLPVGMQAIGRHWEEHLLLRLAFTAEQTVERRAPARFYPVF